MSSEVAPQVIIAACATGENKRKSAKTKVMQINNILPIVFVLFLIIKIN